MRRPWPDMRALARYWLADTETATSVERSNVSPALALLVGSCVCLLLAPLTIPSDYRWVAQSLSEAAAQGLHGAWLARLGFVLLGLAAVLLAQALRRDWARLATFAFMAFGVLMLCAAAFSHSPWQAGQTSDRFEDLLHSIAATLMGFAFVIGVIARALQRRWHRQPGAALDVGAAVIATGLPLLMHLFPEIAGALQRGIFATAYLWFAREAISVRILRRDLADRR